MLFEISEVAVAAILISLKEVGFTDDQVDLFLNERIPDRSRIERIKQVQVDFLQKPYMQVDRGAFKDAVGRCKKVKKLFKKYRKAVGEIEGGGGN